MLPRRVAKGWTTVFQYWVEYILNGSEDSKAYKYSCITGLLSLSHRLEYRTEQGV
jgi:hypothetical protein